MHFRKAFVSLVALLMALLIPSAAQAADAQVSVSVDQTSIVAGVAQNYNYAVTFQSVPDRYTVAVVDSSGRDVIAPQTHRINGGSVNGRGTVTVNEPGRYTVRVAYYAQGSVSDNDWEARASKVFTVTEPPAPPTTPDVVPTPPVTPTPAPTPTPTPNVTLPPQSDESPATLALTKSTRAKTVKPGHKATFTLRVKNTGQSTALNVRLCDLLPGRVTVASAKDGRFQGGQVCWNVGNLRVGQTASRQITLRVDSDARPGRIVNRATATADNTGTVRAQASIRVPRVKKPRHRAPVTG